MYLKILEEAVREKKGEQSKPEASARIDIKVNAFIPDTYIKNHDLRMDMYKRISCLLYTSSRGRKIMKSLQ